MKLVIANPPITVRMYAYIVHYLCSLFHHVLPPSSYVRKLCIHSRDGECSSEKV